MGRPARKESVSAGKDVGGFRTVLVIGLGPSPRESAGKRGVGPWVHLSSTSSEEGASRVLLQGLHKGQGQERGDREERCPLLGLVPQPEGVHPCALVFQSGLALELWEAEGEDAMVIVMPCRLWC